MNFKLFLACTSVSAVLLFAAPVSPADRPDIDYSRAQASLREPAYSGRLDAQRLYGAVLARDPSADHQQIIEGLHWVLLSADGGDGEAQNLVRQMNEYDPEQMKEARASYESFKAALPGHLQKQQADGGIVAMFPDQQRIDRDVSEWAGSVSARVRKFWRRPIGSTDKFTCTIRVEQSPLGKVLNAQVARSCGSEALDMSVVRAVYTASPLPPLPASVPFESSFQITFCPSPGACQ